MTSIANNNLLSDTKSVALRDSAIEATPQMSRNNPQAPSAVIMVRPHHFSPNPETAADNAFQRKATSLSASKISQQAYQECSVAAEELSKHGITVHIFEDETTSTPDSVFPNNWFSTHAGGHIALYPMFTPNRRKERRYDIIDTLKNHYRVQDVVDYSGLEHDGLYLEGTGAMVVDHLERIVYVVASNRANAILLERFCAHFNYEPMVFDAVDNNGTAVYHTNVLMGIATEFALIGLELIPDLNRRTEIVNRLTQSGREVIALSSEQIENFAGNAIELNGTNGRILVLSQRAFDALLPEQIKIIEQSASLLPLDVGTIEMAGGSIRCMLAGIHLSQR